MNEILSTQSYKGTQDLLFEEFQIQKYIFDIWREVCLRFNYKEYLTPTIENSQIYKAKSGSVKDELFVLTDRGGRDLALRPEMTPSVTRVVSTIYKQVQKPIRLFSIANFFRNEAPQKGRLREFWQLNADIFGSELPESDGEIMSLAIEIMLAFNAPVGSFKLFFNNRILINDLFDTLPIDADKKADIARIMDKFSNIGKNEVIVMLEKLSVENEKIEQLILFLESNDGNFVQNFPQLASSKGYTQLLYIRDYLINLGYKDFIEFKPSIIRGFDYYDGIVFEIFDQNPSNKRSLFGGGRYNGLSEIFGQQNFPATGFAPGNATTKLFLKNWNLLPDFSKNDNYYLPLLSGTQIVQNLKIAQKLRSVKKTVELDFNEKNLSDAIRYANKQNFKYIVINGQDEQKANQLSIKNLYENSQKTYPLDGFERDI